MVFSCLPKLHIFLTVWMKTKCSASQVHEYFRLFKIKLNISRRTEKHLKKNKNRIEELGLELMKKEIEIARLKKGYIVKGVGAEKEFVTTFDKNTK